LLASQRVSLQKMPPNCDFGAEKNRTVTLRALGTALLLIRSGIVFTSGFMFLFILANREIVD